MGSTAAPAVVGRILAANIGRAHEKVSGARVNSPPSAGRRSRRGRREDAEDFQAKAQRSEEFPDWVAFATSHEKAAWFS